MMNIEDSGNDTVKDLRRIPSPPTIIRTSDNANLIFAAIRRDLSRVHFPDVEAGAWKGKVHGAVQVYPSQTARHFLHQDSITETSSDDYYSMDLCLSEKQHDCNKKEMNNCWATSPSLILPAIGATVMIVFVGVFMLYNAHTSHDE